MQDAKVLDAGSVTLDGGLLPERCFGATDESQCFLPKPFRIAMRPAWIAARSCLTGADELPGTVELRLSIDASGLVTAAALRTGAAISNATTKCIEAAFFGTRIENKCSIAFSCTGIYTHRFKPNSGDGEP